MLVAKRVTKKELALRNELKEKRKNKENTEDLSDINTEDEDCPEKEKIKLED